ncbi:CBF/NF-Y family transcription factor, putative [Talaromyces stipitatus ATCC 10500]|uniref:NCT transcriptional regulatory complex subunit A n=1 Tax=Talaromyces stipitatus (strain ATCC 10500 / CBS 375.48 / QM 6759 / NRRL 1006) TaxID=441959 RepID=B8M7U8_TALSN|nr:CBF/NF-Y family transcription factor, putative [Talaromyces stipitatus ATCC 10500]EED19827.1 CBF/NF-Y family transcription factor, putative [Talaromyces stipitatus ATCC 10500]
MTDPESSYRPRSPDFSSFPSFPNNTFNNNDNDNNNNAYQPQPPYLASPLGQRASYDASPFFASGYQPPVVNNHVHQPYHQPFLYLNHNTTLDNNAYDSNAFDDMARRSARLSAQAQTQTQPPPSIHAHVQSPAAHQSEQNFIFDQHVAPKKEAESDERIPKPWDGIDVKTKFPVARIKRIMQADEEVGKVAQVTPIAVSKALELFMISLVTKAAQEARDRNSKRVTAAHLKQAVAKDEVLDFLADICSKVPDQPARKNDEDGSDHNNEGKRKSGGGRRKRDLDSDDF